MKEYQINLIDGIKPQEKIEMEAPLIRKKRIPAFWRVVIFILIVVFFYSNRVFFTKESILTHLGRLPFWEGVVRLILQQDKVLKGELTDRTNFLILGMGGAEHEGPYLTDTIILASLQYSRKRAALIFVPRDLYVFSKNFGWQKINALNALGLAQKKDGIMAAKETLENIFETPIHYWLRVDFKGFKKLVDLLGGLEINIERNFVDYSYPAPNYRFQTISFEKGFQTLNSERVLQFVRSRHGTNGEDSDFARMKRQQKVILALREKIEKKGIILNPGKIFELYNLAIQNISTNIELAETIRLAKVLKTIAEDRIITCNFEIGPAGELIAETATNGAYILRPRTGNFQELAERVKNIFNQPPEVNPSSNLFNEKAKISLIKVIILNGTFMAGLAKTQAELLADNFEVIEIGNAPERNITKTIIYDLTQGGKEKDLLNLKETLKAEVKIEIPAYLQEKKADFVIVVGKE